MTYQIVINYADTIERQLFNRYITTVADELELHNQITSHQFQAEDGKSIHATIVRHAPFVEPNSNSFQSEIAIYISSMMDTNHRMLNVLVDWLRRELHLFSGKKLVFNRSFTNKIYDIIDDGNIIRNITPVRKIAGHNEKHINAVDNDNDVVMNTV